MSQAPVAPDFHQTLDVSSALAPQLTFYGIFLLYDGSDLALIVSGQRMNSDIVIHSCLIENSTREASANAVDIREANDNSLIFGQVYARYSCHLRQLPSAPGAHPCLCLCLGSPLQITRMTPLRFTILHLSQRFFTEALTFIPRSSLPKLLVSV